MGHSQELSEQGREGMSNSEDLKVRGDLRDHLTHCPYFADVAKRGESGSLKSPQWASNGRQD